jgi:hypothetical protein
MPVSVTSCIAAEVPHLVGHCQCKRGASVASYEVDDERAEQPPPVIGDATSLPPIHKVGQVHGKSSPTHDHQRSVRCRRTRLESLRSLNRVSASSFLAHTRGDDGGRSTPCP